jgi:hypothetical protein
VTKDVPNWHRNFGPHGAELIAVRNTAYVIATKTNKRRVMKFEKIKGVCFGAALIAGMATTASAQVSYEWVPAAGNLVSSSGSLTFTGGVVNNFSFTEGALGTDNTFDGFPLLGPHVLGDGDLQLVGESGGNSGPIVIWAPNPLSLLGGPAENLAVSVPAILSGAWVPVVPEPATIISGMLLLLPFGASTLRILRQNRIG